MSIMCGVFPENPYPTKYQMEELFSKAIMRSKLTPEVRATFGLTEVDGDIRIGVSLDKARKHFPAFYNSLSDCDRAMFQIRFLNGAAEYIEQVLANIQEGTKIDTQPFIERIQQLRVDVSAAIAKEYKEEVLR